MSDYKTKQKQNIKDFADRLQDSLEYKLFNGFDSLEQMLFNQTLALDNAFKRQLAASDSEVTSKDGETTYVTCPQAYESALNAQKQCYQTVNAIANFTNQDIKCKKFEQKSASEVNRW